MSKNKNKEPLTRCGRLSTLAEVRAELSRTYRLKLNGHISDTTLGALGSHLTKISGVIREEQQIATIEAVEARLDALLCGDEL
jgi:hypothetical protein